MSSLSHTREIFDQLAATDGADGVKTIIENHDAWLQNTAISLKISQALRTQLERAPRPAHISQRIEAQRQRLESLLTRLPMRISTAG